MAIKLIFDIMHISICETNIFRILSGKLSPIKYIIVDVIFLKHLKIYKVSYPGNYCLRVRFYLMVLIYTRWTLYRKEGSSKNTKMSWTWFKDFWVQKGFHSNQRKENCNLEMSCGLLIYFFPLSLLSSAFLNMFSF